MFALAVCCCCCCAVLQWRYAVGEDREALVKATRQETAEDKAAKEKVHQIKGEDGALLKLKVDKLLGRRKLKKDYEYEVQWQGKGPEAATWLTRDDLVEMGLEKMVADLDMKEAARAVSDGVPLGAFCFLAFVAGVAGLLGGVADSSSSLYGSSCDVGSGSLACVLGGTPSTHRVKAGLQHMA